MFFVIDNLSVDPDTLDIYNHADDMMTFTVWNKAVGTFIFVPDVLVVNGHFRILDAYNIINPTIRVTLPSTSI